MNEIVAKLLRELAALKAMPAPMTEAQIDERLRLLHRQGEAIRAREAAKCG